MQPVKTYSPTVFGAAMGTGAVLFVVLMVIAWTTGTQAEAELREMVRRNLGR